MISFFELLARERALVSDGAMGTELQKCGLEPGACPEALNTDRPETVSLIHKSYADAGSDIILTNTFGANRSRLKLHSFEHRVKEFCEAGVELARSSAREREILIAGSIGPCGDILSPLGALEEDEAFEIFREPAEALAGAGVDLIVIETMMAPEEAVVALRAVKSVTTIPVVVSMTYEKGISGIKTLWGTDIPTATELLEKNGADVIGANCGKGFDEMEEIGALYRESTKIPLWLKANAGIPEWIDGMPVYTQSPEYIRNYLEKMVTSAPCIIGGCCGSTPGHIKTIRETVNLYKSKFI